MGLPEKLHPDMQILLDARESVGGVDTSTKSVDSYRTFWERYYRAITNPRPDDIEVVDSLVPVSDATGRAEVPIRIYRSASVPNNAPCIIYMHGGGFMLGDLESSDIIAWGFTSETNAVTISVDYRLAPEHPYPAALNDTYAVLCWASENAIKLGINPDQIALVGDSAGGCLATAACLLSNRLSGPSVAAQAMIYPAVGVALDAPSYVENANAVGLTTASMKFYLENYLQKPDDWADVLARPILAGEDELSALPPAFIHTAEFDPIRDDGRIYAANLARAGCNVIYREVPGVVHGFYRIRLVSMIAANEFGQVCNFLQQTLASKNTS